MSRLRRFIEWLGAALARGALARAGIYDITPKQHAKKDKK